MFAMSYFKTEDESFYLAISRDAYTWTTINGGQPILRGTVNTKTMRDPFIMRDENGIFHLFCTDGWRSQYIIHSFSYDLINWSDQEALPVMVNIPGARNSWAPECFYDHEANVYRIIWSSTVSVDGPQDLRDHRIWSTSTKDFKHFSPSELFFDPGYNIIDATVYYYNNRYWMAFKDERLEHKFIRICTAEMGKGPFENISEAVTPSWVEGPSLFRSNNKWIMFYDHFRARHYGASISEDGYHWEVITDKVSFPAGARHGSILAIDEDIYNLLASKK